MRDSVSRLCARLRYTFDDGGLLETALTHRSVGRNNNERLEFLGDSVLNFLVAELLFERFPDASEGELTRLRAKLVRRETLAEFARDVELGSYLALGGGELKSGGRARDSILADAFEAVIGAVYLDSNLEACRNCLLVAAGSTFDQLEPRAADKDSKTRLQELLQSKHLPLPVYVVSSLTGEDHEHTFTVECTLPTLDHTTVGVGLSRRVAEQDAASRALRLLMDSEHRLL